MPRATYLKAQSAFRTGDFNQSLATAREGLRRWPAGDPGWKFRFVAAEDPIYLGHVRDAGAVLESAPGPSDDALQAALACRDTPLTCMVRLRLGDLAAGSREGEAYLRAALADASTSAIHIW